MKNSLLIKLVAAFVVVVLASASMTALLANRAAGSELQVYVEQSDRRFVEALAPLLGNYYIDQEGSWEGVDQVLESAALAGTVAQPGRGPQRGQQQANRIDVGLFLSSRRFILTESSGQVVYDSADQSEGEVLPRETLAAGFGIVQTPTASPIGWIVLGQNPNTELEQAFISRFNRSIFFSSVGVGALAILIAVIIARRIVAPIRRVTAASQDLAAGNLSHRVPVTGNDEVGKLAHSFNDMAEKLEAGEAHRRRMLADVAHELRNPLTAMRGSLEGMVDGVLPMDRPQIAAVYDQTLVLSRLVEDLRLLSLAEAHQLPLEREPVRLNELVEQIAEDFQALALDSQVDIAVNAPRESPPMSVDRHRISQVMANLLSNALRYAGEGGSIHVDMRDVDSRVEVSIRDSGPGIAPDDLPHIFDRFYRAEKSRVRSTGGGSGLGLAIVKELVEAHGGRVWVESAPGQGATFTFTLPRS